MRALIIAVVVLVLGMVGAVVINESTKADRPAAQVIDEGAEVATISTGEAVDLRLHVPREGWTILEFTAAF